MTDRCSGRIIAHNTPFEDIGARVAGPIRFKIHSICVVTLAGSGTENKAYCCVTILAERWTSRVTTLETSVLEIGAAITLSGALEVKILAVVALTPKILITDKPSSGIALVADSIPKIVVASGTPGLEILTGVAGS